MKKLSFVIAAAMLVAAGALYAAGHNQITRLTRGVVNVGGTDDTSGTTAVVSNDPTNEFRVIAITATVTSPATTATNSFGVTFLATPTVVIGLPTNGATGANTASVNVTPTTTNVLTKGLSAAGAALTNGVPLIIYGYTRTGTFE